MTPRVVNRKKTPSNNNLNSSSKKFVFPADEPKNDGSLSKQELEKLLLERTEALEEWKENFETLR